jgi:uncharacterized protein YbgA (DUF1722 family)/uncharacterized protein YbbK (DUF523 family)
VGRPVRYDGGHKRDAFLTDTLGSYVEFVTVCPEVELGLGTPRETLRLEREGRSGVRLVFAKSREDITGRMRLYSTRRVAKLAAEDLSGYVLKKNSPSCGMERVKVWSGAGVPAANGRGLFAEALLARFPNLPVEEEGRLQDPRLRENFVERVFAYRRLRDLFGRRWSVGDLVRFHTSSKLILLAHSQAAYRELGRLVARAREIPRAELAREYEARFMAALSRLATPRSHANVLQHMAGYFKKQLDAPSRAELSEVIHDYRRGLVPLVAPLTLIRHYVRALDVEYLRGQDYLEPHPKELMLRNHV